jgi:hypothetical protein
MFPPCVSRRVFEVGGVRDATAGDIFRYHTAGGRETFDTFKRAARALTP